MELIDLVNFVLIFLCQMTLLRSLAFLLGFLTVTVTVLFFWIYFYLLTLVFVLQRPYIGKFWSCGCLSFHWFSVKLKVGCRASLYSLWLVLIGTFFMIIWDISASAAAREFCEWVQLGIHVWIPHHKYEVKP